MNENEKIVIRRLLPDVNCEEFLDLGTSPEYEFTFEFEINDEELNMTLKAAFDGITLKYSNDISDNPFYFRVIFDPSMYPKLYKALESIRSGEEKVIHIDSERHLDHINVSITEMKTIVIEANPHENKKKKQQLKDQIEFSLDKLDWFLKVMKRAESLPFREKVTFSCV